MEFLNEKIEKIALPFLDEMDAELVDLNIHRHRGEVTIQILADKSQGGITINDCAALNRKIRDAFEMKNIIMGPYVLEVSSPGLDRPLKTIKDFRRVIGREVRFFLSEAVAERIEHAGVVKNVDDDRVIIKAQNIEIAIPLGKINKAKQMI